MKEEPGISLMLKAQRFQAITSMSVTREVEGISMLHLACPLLPLLFFTEGKGGGEGLGVLFQSGAASGFSCSGAGCNAQGLVCWQLGAGLLLAWLCFLAFE